MPAFLTFDSISATTPDQRPLFTDLTLSIGAERIGLVGRNGSGKSTLLRIAAGMAEPVRGNATRNGTVGLLEQDWADDLSIADVLGVTAMLERIERITGGRGDDEDLSLVDWTLEGRIEAAFAEAGLSAPSLDRSVGTLSGGERMRVGIARLLIQAPDLLLLDEPTNNLDAAGRDAIAALIAGWRGAVLVASHDRALLEGMDRIIELTAIGARSFGGGWTEFAAARDAERMRAESELQRARDQLRNTERQAQRQHERKQRRDKAGRALASRGSEPRILLGAKAERAENSGGRERRLAERLIAGAAERLESTRAQVEVVTPLTMDLPLTGLPANRELLAMDAVTVAAGRRRLGPWTFDIRGAERVAVTGPNGAGKTSLMRAAMGLTAPASGTVRRAEGRLAMLDQHLGLLDRTASILDNFRRVNPSLGEQAAHAACARFAFRNRDALKPVEVLSGGERLRAALACVLAGERPPWLLMLDEPTNHLDMDSIALLETALADYDGALLVASHDAPFLEAIGIAREIKLSMPG